MTNLLPGGDKNQGGGSGIFGGESIFKALEKVLTGTWQGNIDASETREQKDVDTRQDSGANGRISWNISMSSDRSQSHTQSLRTEMADVDDEEVPGEHGTTKRTRRGIAGILFRDKPSE